MSNLSEEAKFFSDIVPMVRSRVVGFNGKAPIAKQKGRIGDYATEIDIAVEELIVNELQKRFPDDAILAEEGHSDAVIPDGRIWIIDPICGTTNLGRGMKSFCTNIALADNHKIIAACVIDQSQDDYFWSVGGQQLYVNDQEFQQIKRDMGFGKVIDVDFGAVANVDALTKKKISDAAFELINKPDYMLQSLNTSLGFAYTAVGKIDGFINVFNHPWDISAASFLLEQSGGVITDLAGGPWQLTSVGAIGARNKDIHKKLLGAYSVN